MNLSQSLERMGKSKHMPCVTPRGEFYHIGEDRYLTGMAPTYLPKRRLVLVLLCFVFLMFLIKKLFCLIATKNHLNFPARCGEAAVPILPFGRSITSMLDEKGYLAECRIFLGNVFC